MSGRIASLNASSQGGVPKLPIREARLHEWGLEGDAVRDRKHHGGPMRALCLYALERIEGLQKEGHSIFPGAIGENVTTVGLDWDLVQPGVRLALGECEVEIVSFAVPCRTTSPYVSGDLFRYRQEENPGWSRVYARVLVGGMLRVGDDATIL